MRFESSLNFEFWISVIIWTWKFHKNWNFKSLKKSIPKIYWKSLFTCQKHKLYSPISSSSKITISTHQNSLKCDTTTTSQIIMMMNWQVNRIESKPTYITPLNIAINHNCGEILNAANHTFVKFHCVNKSIENHSYKFHQL